MSIGKLAITGFPGWLTTALLDDLLAHPAQAPDELVLLAHPANMSAAATAAARYPWRSSVVPLELGAPLSVTDALRGVDVLVHTAAVIHVRRTDDWYRINTQGTIALANDAKRAGVSRFVMISSIAAAGKSLPDRHLVEEDASKPMHHYGRSKLLAERALLELHEPGKFEVVILRPSMFYGPPVPQRHIDVYKRILTGQMPLVGGGNFNRSLIHIDNLTQAVRLAMVTPRAAGQTYFIVDRSIYTTRSVVEAMAEALGTKPRYVHLPAFMAEGAYQVDRALAAAGIYVTPIHLLGEAHWHQSASCSKAERDLGYAPAVELREGMHGAIAWCRTAGKL